MESKQDTLTVPVYNHQKDPEGDSPDAKSAIQLVDGSIKPSYTNRHILVGGAITILKNMSAWVNGKDDIPYMKWNIKNDPNHQPVYNWKPTLQVQWA